MFQLQRYFKEEDLKSLLHLPVCYIHV